jgi:hypothetical protein
VTEPATDNGTGNIVFLLTPNGAPLPVNANPHAQSPLYLPLYPLKSTIPPSEFECQTGAATGVGNCTHFQVLQANLPWYDNNPADANGTSKACVDFGNSNPCTVYLGHDHLIGTPSTGGDFNVAWSIKLVVFTPKAFGDGAINNRIKTLTQIAALQASGDVIVTEPVGSFNCSIVPKATYQRGTPVSYQFP